MHMNLPKLKKDIYWDDSAARPPYTLAAADYCIPSFLGSTIEMGYVLLIIPYMARNGSSQAQCSRSLTFVPMKKLLLGFKFPLDS